jgi:hypothetical protein
LVLRRDVDLHLVESRGTWLLTVRDSEVLRTALAGAEHDALAATLSVLVEPNLLPADAFEAAVVVLPSHAAQAADPAP